MMNAKQWTKKKEALEVKIAEILQELEEVKDDCQEGFDDKSERWQESDKGQAVEGFIGELEEMIDAVNDIQIPEWPV